MKSYTIQFDYLSGDFPNDVINREPVLLKGATTVVFSFTGVNEKDYKVDALHISWGNTPSTEIYKRDLFFNYKSQSIFNEVLYGRLGGSILNTYSHDFFNETIKYGANYTAKILLVKNNGSYAYIKQPLVVYWDSFYDNIKKISLLNSQVIPLSTNFTFINLETKEDRFTIPCILDRTSTPLLAHKGAPIIPLRPYGVTDIEEFVYLSENESSNYPPHGEIPIPVNTVNPESNIIVIPGFGDQY